MASPLTGSLAKTIGSAFKGLFLDAVLTRETPGEPDPDRPFDPPAPTVQTFRCKALQDQFSATLLAGGLVASDDVKLLILAASLTTTPQSGDRVTVRWQTFTIVPGGGSDGMKAAVATDPALAIWECRGRGGGAVFAPYSPSFDFSDPRNSGYLALLEDI